MHLGVRTFPNIESDDFYNIYFFRGMRVAQVEKLNLVLTVMQRYVDVDISSEGIYF
jgi:hypothetical protein